MPEGVAFAMEIGQEVFGALWQIGDGFEVDDFSGGGGYGGVGLCQEAKVSFVHSDVRF